MNYRTLTMTNLLNLTHTTFSRQASRDGFEFEDDIPTVSSASRSCGPLISQIPGLSNSRLLRRHDNAPLTNPVIHSFRLYLNR